jgi:NADH-quinone oxidoreductase subunit G
VGVRPDVKGLSAREMWAAAGEGRIKAMIVAGSNPARQSATARRGLEALEFLVVADLFLTETAQAADIVLPLAAFAEREGTFTNAERRVQRFRQALEARADLPAAWDVFQNIARALPETLTARAVPVQQAQAAAGKKNAAPVAVPTLAVSSGWDYIVASDVADEIATSVRGYAGTTYTSLGLTKAVNWGRQSDESVYYDGTSYENGEGVGIQTPTEADDQRTSFAVTFRAPLAAPDGGQFRLALIVAPRAYDNGDWGIGSKIGPRMVPAHAILSRSDAEALGVAIGERVLISSERGAIELPITVDAGLAAGTVVVPLVRGAEVGDLVTGAVTAVSLSKVG